MGTRGLDYAALAIVIIGAVNWGLIGFFRFDLVAFLFGNMSWISRTFGITFTSSVSMDKEQIPEAFQESILIAL